jgi:hypothetical protein
MGRSRDSANSQIPRSAHASARIYSLTLTTLANGIEPYYSIVMMLGKLPAAKTEDAGLFWLMDKDRDYYPCFFLAGPPGNHDTSHEFAKLKRRTVLSCSVQYFGLGSLIHKKIINLSPIQTSIFQTF